LDKIKLKIYDYLHPHRGDPLPERVFNYLFSTLILLNVLSVLLETVRNFYFQFYYFFYYFEIFSIIIFTIEYILRLWTITCDPEYSNPVTGRIRYMFSFFAIVDFLSVFPFFLPYAIQFDPQFVRIFRFLRFIRILKIVRYSHSLKTFGRIIQEKRKDLLMAFFLILFLVVMSSYFIYIAESEVQPGKYDSIPECLYWSIITLTTVGYGDVFPVTTLGKVFTAMIAILGVGLMALPTGIIISGFLKQRSEKKFKCPHCKKEITIK